MAPAQQCLDADQLALHVDQRLVVQLQLLAGQRIAQVAQQGGAAIRRMDEGNRAEPAP